MTATSSILPPSPRSVRLLWESICGPNFQYLLHVTIYSLIPLILFLWFSFIFAWAAFGTTVEGHFFYALQIKNAGVPKDQMQVDYKIGKEALTEPVSLNPRQLHQLGMPCRYFPGPGSGCNYLPRWP